MCGFKNKRMSTQTIKNIKCFHQ